MAVAIRSSSGWLFSLELALDPGHETSLFGLFLSRFLLLLLGMTHFFGGPGSSSFLFFLFLFWFRLSAESCCCCCCRRTSRLRCRINFLRSDRQGRFSLCRDFSSWQCSGNCSVSAGAGIGCADLLCLGVLGSDGYSCWCRDSRLSWSLCGGWLSAWSSSYSAGRLGLSCDCLPFADILCL